MSFNIQSLCICLFLSLSVLLVSAKTELKLLHVLSANKFYVPDYDYTSSVLEIPNQLSYKYFVENAMDMPNSVKLDLFNLGVNLRKEYGTFIGSIYMDEVIKMQTTTYPVSIMAGELINAGLWPPVGPQIWNDDLSWQPIPFVYKAVEEDTELLGTLCPNFEYETASVLQNHYNLSQVNEELLTYINTEGNVNVTSPIDVSLLYLAVENSVQLNQSRPEWLNKIFPSQQLLNLTLSAYDLLSKTTVQKRLNGGSLLKAIIKDSKDRANGVLNKARKINVYSGDERNFAGLLKNLNIPFDDLPSAGAALIFELIADANDYFIKILYYTGSAGMEMLPYTLDGCELLCPLDKFKELVADVLPANELSLCGSMVSNETNARGGASSISHSFSNTLFIILSLIAVHFIKRS